MPNTLDVYRDWLKIQEPARPLNYYQLLRLKKFTDDPAAVRNNYRQLASHVKKLTTGEHAARAKELLAELNKAMLCLTDSRRKSDYDASLGRTGEADRSRRTVDAILVGRKVVDATQLEKARKLADTLGVDLHSAVIQQKLAAPDVVMQAYAESMGLSYVDLADVPVDPELVPKVPAVLARQYSLAPLLVDDGQVLVAAPMPIPPEVEEQLRLRLGMPVRAVICTPAAIHGVIEKFYPREAAAAQMAAASAQPAASSNKGPAGVTLSPEERKKKRKEQLMVLLVAFNFPVFAYMIVAMNFTHWYIDHGALGSLARGLGLGLLAAGITFLVQKFR